MITKFLTLVDVAVLLNDCVHSNVPVSLNGNIIGGDERVLGRPEIEADRL